MGTRGTPKTFSFGIAPIQSGLQFEHAPNFERLLSVLNTYWHFVVHSSIRFWNWFSKLSVVRHNLISFSKTWFLNCFCFDKNDFIKVTSAQRLKVRFLINVGCKEGPKSRPWSDMFGCNCEKKLPGRRPKASLEPTWARIGADLTPEAPQNRPSYRFLSILVSFYIDLSNFEWF